MCYDLAIAENGFSAMDVDELLWINGGSGSIEYHKETKDTKTTTTYPDGRTETKEEHTETTDFKANVDGSNFGEKVQAAWNFVKSIFSKGNK